MASNIYIELLMAVMILSMMRKAITPTMSVTVMSLFTLPPVLRVILLYTQPATPIPKNSATTTLDIFTSIAMLMLKGELLGHRRQGFLIGLSLHVTYMLKILERREGNEVDMSMRHINTNYSFPYIRLR
jgi:hypothetical protein